MSTFARILIFTIVLSGTAVLTLVQTAPDRIRNAVASHYPAAAISEIEALESDEPEVYLINT